MKPPKLRPVIDIYEDSAPFWAAERSQSPFREKKYMDMMLAKLSPGDALLDLGCGSGFPIADYFLQHKIKVTGVDAAPAMIAVAKAKYPQARWQVADMRSLNLSQKFDALVAWDSFFHLDFAEQEKMFPIFRAHLNLGGILIFTSGPERGEAIGDMNGHPLFHASLSPAEYRRLLETNGFEIVHFASQDPDCGGHTVWVCQVA